MHTPSKGVSNASAGLSIGTLSLRSMVGPSYNWNLHLWHGEAPLVARISTGISGVSVMIVPQDTLLVRCSFVYMIGRQRWTLVTFHLWRILSVRAGHDLCLCCWLPARSAEHIFTYHFHLPKASRRLRHNASVACTYSTPYTSRKTSSASRASEHCFDPAPVSMIGLCLALIILLPSSRC